MMTQRRGLLWAGAGLALWPGRARAQVLRARIPRPPRDVDLERFYPLRLLRAALAASGQPHQIELTAQPIIQARALRELESDSGVIDLVWSMSSQAREQGLRAVPVPLYGGLYGWRLLLIRKGEAARFAGLRNLDDLRRLRFVQGSDWPDRQVLEANGLQVDAVPSFEGLFARLAQGAVDAFPRSALEIWSEARQQAARFEVEPLLALRYPAPMLFFVAPGNAALAQALEMGLLRLHERGELMALLTQLHAEELQRARLAQRRVIELRNPLLGADYREDKRFLYRP
ncbi:hypothetical protein [Inhella sp.]|uniref:hypothetical protein n=1 Tax=Inhella sp. TaxID=1921806 RepID=UPI0035B1062E